MKGLAAGRSSARRRNPAPRTEPGPGALPLPCAPPLSTPQLRSLHCTWQAPAQTAATRACGRVPLNCSRSKPSFRAPHPHPPRPHRHRRVGTHAPTRFPAPNPTLSLDRARVCATHAAHARSTPYRPRRGVAAPCATVCACRSHPSPLGAQPAGCRQARLRGSATQHEPQAGPGPAFLCMHRSQAMQRLARNLGMHRHSVRRRWCASQQRRRAGQSSCCRPVRQERAAHWRLDVS